MEGSIIVVFCSKYSQKCKEFIDIIRDNLDYRKIYVDNKEIRDTILDEYEKYSIRIVPTVLIFYSNGIMNKYEGNKAFEWAINVCKTIKKDLEPIKTSPIIIDDSFYKNIPTLKELSKNKDEPQEVQIINKEESKVMEQNIQSEEDLIGMKRKIETSPLIQRNDSINNDNRMDGNRNEKKILDKKQDNIKLLAQQLQAQREKEDEQLNPNALSKIVS